VKLGPIHKGLVKDLWLQERNICMSQQNGASENQIRKEENIEFKGLVKALWRKPQRSSVSKRVSMELAVCSIRGVPAIETTNADITLCDDELVRAKILKWKEEDSGTDADEFVMSALHNGSWATVSSAANDEGGDANWDPDSSAAGCQENSQMCTPEQQRSNLNSVTAPQHQDDSEFRRQSQAATEHRELTFLQQRADFPGEAATPVHNSDHMSGPEVDDNIRNMRKRGRAERSTRVSVFERLGRKDRPRSSNGSEGWDTGPGTPRYWKASLKDKRSLADHVQGSANEVREAPRDRRSDPRSVKICRDWEVGSCRYGEGCHYAHSWHDGGGGYGGGGGRRYGNRY